MTDILTTQTRNSLVENAINSEIIQSYLKSPNDILQSKVTIPSLNTSNLNVTLFPPGINSILDSKVYLRMKVRVTGTNANLTNLNPEMLVPCNMPINSCLDQLSVSINGHGVTSRPTELLHVYQFVNTDSDYRALSSSFSPTQPDYSASITRQAEYYEQTRQVLDNNSLAVNVQTDASGTNFVPLTLNQRVYNPNSPYSNHFVHAHNGFGETNRRNFPYTAFTAGAVGPPAVAATLDYVFTEPLLSPLFEDNPDSDKALYNIKQLQIDMRFVSNLEKMFQSVSGAALSYTISFVDAEILYRYVVPDEPLPNQLVLPYSEWTLITQAYPGLTNIVGGVPVQQTTSNLTWGQMPSKILIYARPKLSVLNERDSHSIFGCIESVNLQVASRAGLLANMTPQQLWAMSVKNGLDMNWVQWNQSGGPVIISVGEDIPFIPNVSGRVSAQINISVSNRCYQDLFTNAGDLDVKFANQWELCVLSQLDGKFIITPDSASHVLGLSYEEINEAENFDNDSHVNVIGKGYGDVDGEGVLGGFLPLFGALTKPLMFNMASRVLSGRGRGRLGAGIHGGSFWGSLKRGAKNFYRTQIKPVAREMLDTGKIAAANQLYGNSSLGQQQAMGMGILNR